MSNLSVNAIRFLGIDAINKANSGHPGVVMGSSSDGIQPLYKTTSYQSSSTKLDQPRPFILSAGHGSMLLYALLHLSGLKMSAWMRSRASVNGVQNTRSPRIWPYSRS